MNEQSPNENQSIQIYSHSILPKFLQTGKKQITNPLIQTSHIFLEKAKASNNPSEAKGWLELHSKSKAIYLEESKDKQLFDEIIYASDSNERSTLFDLHERFVNKREQAKQQKFLNNMTVTFFVTSIAIGTAGVVLEIPIILGAGGFLLGGSMFGIVPDYLSKVIDKLNIPGIFPTISSNGDDNLNTGDKDKNEDS